MKFQCIHTGNIFTFTAANDITDMLKHPEYKAVVEEEEKKQTIGSYQQVPTKRNKSKEKL